MKPALRSVAERNALVEANLRLADWCVNRAMAREDVRRLGRQAATDAAIDSLIRVAELYDPRAAKFSTYATLSILRAIVRAALKQRYYGARHHRCTNRRPQVKPVTDVPSRHTDRQGNLLLECDDIDRDAVLDVREAVSRLPDPLWSLVRLRFYRGLTRPETGEILGVSDTTIGTWERRALDRLAGELRGENGLRAARAMAAELTGGRS